MSPRTPEVAALKASDFLAMLRADAEALGPESSAALLLDVLRLCIGKGVDPLEALPVNGRRLGASARLREPVLADVLNAFQPAAYEQICRKQAIRWRRAWLREAERLARRDWARCTRPAGVRWSPECGVVVLMHVRFPGVLELTRIEDARLIARSLPGQLAELDPAHDPE